MKQLKQFVLAFFHLFTFMVMMHCTDMLSDSASTYTEFELWFVSALTLGNLLMCFYYLGRVVKHVIFNNMPSYEDLHHEYE